MDERWYAVHTKPRSEDLVSWRLQRHGFEVFLPKLSVPRRRRNRRVTRIETLFPSYLFVRMALVPQRWTEVRWAPGVKRVVGTGDVPVPVPDAAIEILLGRCSHGMVIPWRPEFRPGDQVRIKHGPFTGLIALLERPASRRERVCVLLDLFRGPARVELDVVDIERVS